MKIDQKIENPTAPFVLVEDTKILLPILKARLPRSSHVYNMAMIHPKFTAEMKAYVLNGEVSENSWIVFNNQREDYGSDINISAPLEPQITQEVKDAFANSSMIDWSKPYLFADTDRSVSPMIIEISSFINQTPISIHPAKFYYLDIETAKGLEIEENFEGELKPLDVEFGANFITDTWKYTTEGTKVYVRKIIERNHSSGIYVNGKPVCGVILVANGILGFLYTLKEHRQKGLAVVCMQSIFKSMAQDGFVPCSSAEYVNYSSVKFHEKLGMKYSHTVDFIYYKSVDF